MDGATVLEHAHLAHGHAIQHPLAQHDHAVRHEGHESVAGRGGFILLHFRSENAGEAGAGEPILDAVKFAALGRTVIEQGEKHIECVQDHDLRTHRGRLRFEAGQERREVEPARDHDLRAQAGVQEKKLLRGQAVEVPAEAFRIRQQARRIFLEGDKNAGRGVLPRCAHERLQGEHRLAATRAAHEERGARPGQAAGGDIVKPLDAGGYLFQAGPIFKSAHTTSQKKMAGRPFRLMAGGGLLMELCIPLFHFSTALPR